MYGNPLSTWNGYLDKRRLFDYRATEVANRWKIGNYSKIVAEIGNYSKLFEAQSAMDVLSEVKIPRSFDRFSAVRHGIIYGLVTLEKIERRNRNYAVIPSKLARLRSVALERVHTRVYASVSSNGSLHDACH